MRFTVIFLLVPMLFSCEGKTIQSTFDFNLTAEEYAKIKRIPDRAETRKEAAFESFSERTRIANYLLEGPLKDDVSVQVLAIEAKNKIAIDTYLENFVSSVVTEDKLQTFYEENKAEFMQGTYHASHILLRLPGTENEQEVEAAFAKAQEISQKIAEGEDFSTLATAYSDDSSSKDAGGKLPPISTRNGDPAIVEALASLAEGEVSKPVRTRLGVQLFRLDAKEETYMDYEKVKDKIAYQLKRTLKEKEFTKLGELAVSGHL